MTTVANIVENEDEDVAVTLRQHLFEKEFRDEIAKTTLRVLTVSTQTVGEKGIERMSTIDILSDVREVNGDERRIVKGLSPGDSKKIDDGSVQVIKTVENYRPGFKRPLAEISATVLDGIVLGAVKRDGQDWVCFVELENSGRRLRCAVGDFEQLYDFQISVSQAGNFQ